MTTERTAAMTPEAKPNAGNLPENIRWRGPDPVPPCWVEPDGTVVFRDYESYVFDDDVPAPNPPRIVP